MAKRKNVKIKINLSLLAAFVTLAVLFYWVWMFYMTQPAAEVNTYRTHEVITDVTVRHFSRSGTDKLLVDTDFGRYMIDTGWSNEDGSTDLAERIVSLDGAAALTVWKHFPKNVFEPCGSFLQVWQIVDLRDNGNVYWDMLDHNHYQMRERLVGVIAGIFLSAVVIAFDFISWTAGYNVRIKKRKKRKKTDNN